MNEWTLKGFRMKPKETMCMISSQPCASSKLVHLQWKLFSCTFSHTFFFLFTPALLLPHLVRPPWACWQSTVLQSFTSFNRRVKVSLTEWSFCQALITGSYRIGFISCFQSGSCYTGYSGHRPRHVCPLLQNIFALSALIVQFYSESNVAKDISPENISKNHIHTHMNYIHIQLHILSCSCILTAATHLLPLAWVRCHHAYFLSYCCELTPGMVANMHPHPLLIVGRDQRNSGWGERLARLRGQGCCSPRVWEAS